MTDIGHTIKPKSDQLNADDLIGGAITIRIRDVKIHGIKDDQPVSIFYDGDDNKPFKPCKSMRRVLVKVWGRNSATYAGKSMTLFNDPDVLWAGAKVGGIRISHMSGLDSEVKMALTESKSKRKPFTVQPLDVQVDKAKDGAEALIARIQSSDDPTALSAEEKVIKQRDWLENNRPELAARVTNAFALSRTPQQSEPPPPEEDYPDADDGGYEGV